MVRDSGQSASISFLGSTMTDAVLFKDIKIKQGKEFFSTYVLSQETTASPIYETKIYVYRGTQAKPPEFVTFPGT